MKINKSQYKKWINALRSGKYKQTKEKLQDENGYCCLGVACKILIKEPRLNVSGFIAGELPDCQENSPDWLKKINEFFGRKYDEELAILNDSFNYSFDDIADYLELVGLSEGWL